MERKLAAQYNAPPGLAAMWQAALDRHAAEIKDKTRKTPTTSEIEAALTAAYLACNCPSPYKKTG